MTDSTAPAPSNAPVSIAAQISSMVANPGKPLVHQQNIGGMTINNDGKVTRHGNQPDDGGRITDTGQDIAGSSAQIMASITALDAKLAEQVYDPVTGKGSPKVTGIERDKLEAAAKQARISAHWDLQRLQALQEQRLADKARETQGEQEQRAEYAFTKGDPARAAAYKEAMLREEATEAARLVIAARRGR